jgi:hypothetical protein
LLLRQLVEDEAEFIEDCLFSQILGTKQGKYTWLREKVMRSQRNFAIHPEYTISISDHPNGILVNDIRLRKQKLILTLQDVIFEKLSLNI